MLPLTDKGSPWTTPSPTVPKLRLPGSGPRTSMDSEQKTPTAGGEDQHLSVNNRGASSRLGRDAAAQAAQLAASGSTATGNLVPRLSGLDMANLSLNDDDDDEDDENASQAPPTTSTDSDDEDDDRISSAVAALPVPLLELPRGQAPLERAGPSRPLDRVISAAISLDRGWLPSARTAAAASEASAASNDGRRRRSTSDGASEDKALPTGFVFSGDLDEDVELLEALERVSNVCAKDFKHPFCSE